MRLLVRSKETEMSYFLIEIQETGIRNFVNKLITQGDYIKAEEMVLAKGKFLGVLSEKEMRDTGVRLIISDNNLHRDLT